MNSYNNAWKMKIGNDITTMVEGTFLRGLFLFGKNLGANSLLHTYERAISSERIKDRPFLGSENIIKTSLYITRFGCINLITFKTKFNSIKIKTYQRVGLSLKRKLFVREVYIRGLKLWTTFLCWSENICFNSNRQLSFIMWKFLYDIFYAEYYLGITAR